MKCAENKNLTFAGLQRRSFVNAVFAATNYLDNLQEIRKKIENHTDHTDQCARSENK